MHIRDVTQSDSERITQIYNHYIENTAISFEEDLVTPEIMLQRIEKVTQSGFSWLVIEVDGKVEGYAYSGEWNGRCAYRYTAETSIYLSVDASGKGLGKRLYTELLAQLKRQNINNVLAVIALLNASSIGLHESLGFNKVGEFKEVGFKFDRLISVGYWQLHIA